jgi:hypothetical protein
LRADVRQVSRLQKEIEADTSIRFGIVEAHSPEQGQIPI